jgi:hypothetical protein
MNPKTKVNLAITVLYLVISLLYFVPYFIIPNFAIFFLSPFKVVSGLVVGGFVYEAVYKYKGETLSHCMICIITLCLVLSVFASTIILGVNSSNFLSCTLARVISMIIISIMALFFSVYIEKYYWKKAK